MTTVQSLTSDNWRLLQLKIFLENKKIWQSQVIAFNFENYKMFQARIHKTLKG